MLEDTGKPICSPKRLNEIRIVLDQVTNKWSIIILTLLCEEPIRFNELKRRLGTITHKSLTETLRKLESHKLIERIVISSSPVAVQYKITNLGKTLEAPILELVRWAEKHADEMLN